MRSPDLKQRLHNHLIQIVRDRDPYLSTAGHFFVRQYIYDVLSQWGEVETHEFEIRSQTFQNLILNLPGANNQQKPPI